MAHNRTNNERTYVYALELEGGYYYVGSSVSVSRRYHQHQNGHGPEWTRIHRPRKIISQKEFSNSPSSLLEEDRLVKELMGLHGIDRVRGASYSNVVLSEDQKGSLQRELRHANNHCLRCGGTNHFSGTCYARIHSKDDPVVDDLRSSSSSSYDDAGGDVICYRCGRNGHISYQCFARTNIDGEFLRQQNVPVAGRSNESSRSLFCIRCGRNGHAVHHCYASTGINGQIFSSDDDDDDCSYAY